jgi:hypothetical protein
VVEDVELREGGVHGHRDRVDADADRAPEQTDRRRVEGVDLAGGAAGSRNRDEAVVGGRDQCAGPETQPASEGGTAEATARIDALRRGGEVRSRTNTTAGLRPVVGMTPPPRATPTPLRDKVARRLPPDRPSVYASHAPKRLGG